ncbi:MAG: hypothetical protein CL411_00770 [Acidimicrobiaceae bacterium]|nr:hypothetical protein [Acidimicrobiaceae bacterium]
MLGQISFCIVFCRAQCGQCILQIIQISFGLFGTDNWFRLRRDVWGGLLLEHDKNQDDSTQTARHHIQKG